MGLSITEIALIVVVALIVIGPNKLPGMAKSLGKGYGEFRRQFDDLKKSVDVSSITSMDDTTSSQTEEKGEFKSKWEAQDAPAEAPAESDSERAKRSDAIKED